MKKLFTTLMTLLAFALFAQAQTSGGPDAYGYIWRDSNDPNGPAFNWIDIDILPGVVSVTNLGDDNMVGIFPLSIPFHYYWYDPSGFRIGSNGYIAFSNGPGISAQTAGFPLIPTPSGQQNFIAPFTTDLILIDDAGGALPGVTCKYWQSPTNDSLIVTWNNVPFWDPTPPHNQGSNTFQIILSTLDSSITFQYLVQNGVYFNANNPVTTGIENNSGTVGLAYLPLGQYPLANMAVKYYYPSNSTFVANDAEVSFTGNAGTKGIFLSKDGAAYASQVEVNNSGNQVLSPFNVYSRVVNSVSAIQVRDTVPTSGTLNPGQSELVSFPDQWSPTIAGTYRHIGVSQLSGDLVAGNNQKDLEIRVVDTTQISILLNFDNGIASAANQLNWAGGNGGGAMYFAPPFYPCVLTGIQVYIADDPNLVGFYIHVFDDDGPNGSALTQLDSVFVPVSLAGAWNFVSLSSPITINSGGFYVGWLMGGDAVALGVDDIAPYSSRCFEILGAPSNPANWADYRESSTQDLMINAFISSTTGIAENNPDKNKFGEFYPNPALYKTSLTYSLKEEADMRLLVYNIKGQLVSEKLIGTTTAGDGIIELNLQNLDAGVYVCKITTGNNEYHKKITVIR